ncbi:hypothetical protein NPIL_1261 [Nephila pilipes]|uniref:Uncharacterized protein n=1 Tax=Nephila pilipes TaxID=299642 RepID=A0A8X6TDL0_NEPPI|nr:hypothetical protein NPIL_1261 [Nephila pilipes]
MAHISFFTGNNSTDANHQHPHTAFKRSADYIQEAFEEAAGTDDQSYRRLWKYGSRAGRKKGKCVGGWGAGGSAGARAEADAQWEAGRHAQWGAGGGGSRAEARAEAGAGWGAGGVDLHRGPIVKRNADYRWRGYGDEGEVYGGVGSGLPYYRYPDYGYGDGGYGYDGYRSEGEELGPTTKQNGFDAYLRKFGNGSVANYMFGIRSGDLGNYPLFDQGIKGQVGGSYGYNHGSYRHPYNLEDGEEDVPANREEGIYGALEERHIEKRSYDYKIQQNASDRSAFRISNFNGTKYENNNDTNNYRPGLKNAREFGGFNGYVNQANAYFRGLFDNNKEKSDISKDKVSYNAENVYQRNALFLPFRDESNVYINATAHKTISSGNIFDAFRSKVNESQDKSHQNAESILRADLKLNTPISNVNRYKSGSQGNGFFHGLDRYGIEMQGNFDGYRDRVNLFGNKNWQTDYEINGQHQLVNSPQMKNVYNTRETIYGYGIHNNAEENRNNEEELNIKSSFYNSKRNGYVGGKYFEGYRDVRGEQLGRFKRSSKSGDLETYEYDNIKEHKNRSNIRIRDTNEGKHNLYKKRFGYFTSAEQLGDINHQNSDMYRKSQTDNEPYGLSSEYKIFLKAENNGDGKEVIGFNNAQANEQERDALSSDYESVEDAFVYKSEIQNADIPKDVENRYLSPTEYVEQEQNGGSYRLQTGNFRREVQEDDYISEDYNDTHGRDIIIGEYQNGADSLGDRKKVDSIRYKNGEEKRINTDPNSESEELPLRPFERFRRNTDTDTSGNSKNKSRNNARYEDHKYDTVTDDITKEETKRSSDAILDKIRKGVVDNRKKYTDTSSTEKNTDLSNSEKYKELEDEDHINRELKSTSKIKSITEIYRSAPEENSEGFREYGIPGMLIGSIGTYGKLEEYKNQGDELYGENNGYNNGDFGDNGKAETHKEIEEKTYEINPDNAQADLYTNVAGVFEDGIDSYRSNEEEYVSSFDKELNEDGNKPDAITLCCNKKEESENSDKTGNFRKKIVSNDFESYGNQHVDGEWIYRSANDGTVKKEFSAGSKKEVPVNDIEEEEALAFRGSRRLLMQEEKEEDPAKYFTSKDEGVKDDQQFHNAAGN